MSMGATGLETPEAGAWQLLLGREALSPRTRSSLVDQLYAIRPAVILVSAVAVAMLGGRAAATAGDATLAALTALAVVSTLGWLPLIAASRRRGSTSRRERVFALYAFAAAATIGCTAAFGFIATDDHGVHVLLVILDLVGVCSVPRRSGRPWIAALQLSGLLGPVAVALAATGNPIYAMLAVGCAALAFNIFELAVGIYRVQVEGYRKEERLIQHNTQFKAALDNMKHGLCMVGADQRVLVCNDRYLEMFGFSADIVKPGAALVDVLEHSIAVGNHHGVTAEKLLRRVTDGLSDTATSFLHNIADGRTFAVTHQPMAGGWAATFEDVTERRVAEAALRESEEHYRYRVELDPLTAWTVDRQGEMIEISGRWLEYTGQPREAALGQGWLDVVHPDDVAMVIETSRYALSTRTNSDVRFRCRGADGEYRWFRARGYPRLDGDGRIIRWYGYSEDIHDQVMADAALRQSEAQLATIFKQAMVGIALTLPGKGIILSNDRFGAILGRSPADVVGLTIDEITHPDDLVWNRPLFEKCAAAGEPMLIEKRYLRPDGTSVWCKVSVAFVAGGIDGQKLAVVIVEDISKRKETDAQLQRLQAELLHVSRSSAMGAMGTAIAHEVNQPLAAATNYAGAAQKLLARSEVPVDKLREVIPRMLAEAMRAGEIIRRLRKLVEKGEAQAVPEDLAELVEDASVAVMSGAKEVGVVPTLDLAAGLVVVADRVQVQQVLHNLARNAVEAMRGSSAAKLTIRTGRRGTTAVVHVEDNGCGLPADVKEQLFQPFVASKGGGMGVGLSICRTIVEAHGGRIWAEELPGGGARFSFTLPLADAADALRVGKLVAAAP